MRVRWCWPRWRGTSTTSARTSWAWCSAATTSGSSTSGSWSPATGSLRQVFSIPRDPDPVHFWPDPDPSNQNLKKGIRVLLFIKLTRLESIQTYKNVSFQSNFFRYLFLCWFFTWKNFKIYLQIHGRWKISGSCSKIPDLQLRIFVWLFLL